MKLPKSLYLLLIVAYCLIVGTLSMVHYHVGGVGIETDFYWDYAPAAKELLTGVFNVEHYRYRGAGYPIMLALGGVFTSDLFLVGKVIAILTSGLFLFFAYKIMRIYVARRWAILGLVFLMLNPVFFEYSWRVGTELPFMALCTIILWILLKDTLSKTELLLLGAIAGIAYITRYNATPLVIFVVIWAVVKRRWIVLVGLLPIVIIWSAALIRSTGNPFFNDNINNVITHIYGNGLNREDVWRGNVVQLPSGIINALITNPLPFFVKPVICFFRNIWFDSVVLLTPGLAAFAILGIGSLKRWQILVIYWFVMFVPIAFVDYVVRYTLPVLIIYCLLLVIGMSKVGFKYSVVFAIVVFYLVANPFSNMSTVFAEMNEQIVDVSKCDIEINDDSIVSRKPHIPYLLGKRFVVAPYRPSLEILHQWMIMNGEKYFELSDFELSLMPGLKDFYKSEGEVGGFVPVYQGDNFRIWKVKE